METVTKRGKYRRAQIRRLGFPLQHKSFDSHAEAERTTLAEALERYKTAISSRKAHPAQHYQRISHWLRQRLAHRYLGVGLHLRGPEPARR